MYRRPGDLKHRGKDTPATKHRGYYYRRGEYFRFMKNHVWKCERRRVTDDLSKGKEPYSPPTGRSQVLWECW